MARRRRLQLGQVLRAVRAHSWATRLLLVRVTVLIITAWAALRVLPFRVVRRLFASGQKAAHAPWPSPYARQVIGTVEVVGNALLGSRPCLPKALVAQWLLARAGYETELCIGVVKEGRELKAHAWVERDGVVIVGGQSSPDQFTPLRPAQRAVLQPELS